MSTKPVHELSTQHDYARRHTRFAFVTRDYLRGDPIVKIAEKYGIAPATVGKFRKMGNLPKRRPGSSPEVRGKVIENYKQGIKIKDIVAAHGVDRKTIWVIMRKANLPLRRPELARARKHKKPAKRP